MRRLSLSTKLFAAALPLIVAVGGLLALTVRSDLDNIDSAESGADLGAVWEPLITALSAIETEGGTLSPTVGDEAAPDTATDPATRRATDQSINDLRTSIERLDAFEAASMHVTAARSSLSAARRNIDMAAIAPGMAVDVEPAEAYALASRELVAVGQLLPSEAGDVALGRELLAVVKLAEARLHANEVIAGTSAFAADPSDRTPLAQARTSFASMLTTLGEFEAIAPEDWAAAFRQSGFTTALSGFNGDLASAARATDGSTDAFDVAAFSGLVDQGVEFQRGISESIVERATAQAGDARSATLRRIGIILAIVLIGLVIAWFITRSVTRRVKAVAGSANRIASEQLPALVEALRDPRGKAVLPEIEPVDAKGSDDLADLAHAFNSMQQTLIDVAHEQVEVLRRGVSDIFITMARRNRSLIDRQLSMLDEFEASVDDHEVLSNYYQLDHLATRMRRNSESLLVLANAEPKRRRVKATEIDDVVRASIGEVEDYRRIEIQHLDSLQVRGNVVADVSHLLAELLDNATSFSPPGSAVRVGGRRADDSYLLRIVDDGVGIGPDRLAELNELLREPPIVGLSVESTLGISVVSLLANKHNINVALSAGSPGLTVDVILPSSLFGPMDAPAEQPVEPVVEPQPADEQMISWNEQAVADLGVPTLATDADGTWTPATLPTAEAAVAAPEPMVTYEPLVAESAAVGSVQVPDFEPLVTDEPVETDPITAELPATEPTSVEAADIGFEPLVTDESAESDPIDIEASSTDFEPLVTDEPVETDPIDIETYIAAEPVTESEPTFTADPIAAEANEPMVAEAPVPIAAEANEPIETGPIDHGTPDTDVEATVTADAVATDPFFVAEPVIEPEPTYTAEPITAEASEPIAAEEPVAVADTAFAVESATPAPAAPTSDWTKMSLDLSAFDTPAAPATPAPVETPAATAPALPVFDTTPAPVIEPNVEPVAPVLETTEAPAVPQVAPASMINLPPPATARSEFDVPPAPPISATGPSQRPVSPTTARPAPVPSSDADSAPALPTRTQRGTGPEGPDRLAPRAGSDSDESHVTTSEPGALQAALAAYDSGRAAVNAPVAESLPTRDRGPEPEPMVDEPLPVTQSRVDPSALRDRLRAFQSEFTSASGDNTGGHDIYTDQNPDLGGDPR